MVFAMGVAQAQMNNAMVRVVHASPDAPAVDITVNGVVALEGIPFKGYTGYNPVPAGSYTLGINVAGTNNTVLTTPVTLSAGVPYTFVAAGKVSGGTFRLIGVGDDLADPAEGSVKFRVIHAAGGAPAVDVYATAPYTTLSATNPILTNVPYGIGSGYLTVPAGLYQARVTPAGTKTVAIASPPLGVTSKAVRTIMAIDTMDSTAPFEFWVLPDKN